jgi:transcriptional regulator with XRE-family HTH domain
MEDLSSLLSTPMAIAETSPAKKSNKKRVDQMQLKRKSLTGTQKAEICHLKQKGLSQVALANQFGVAEATISNILREKTRWLSIDPSSHNAILKRQRASKFPLLEEALSYWVSRATMVSQMITGIIIQQKAIQFANQLNMTDFNASEGWLSNFKKRFHIKEYKHQGEAASAPLEDIPQFRAELREIIKEYQPEDVYNADETGLYWRMEPDKSLASGPLSGKKKAKDRVTILLTCNITGDKLPPLLIYKFKNPRPLRSINKDTLPVYYYWNSSAWMQSSIFNHYVRKLDLQMRCAGRSILLLLDNSSTHTLEEDYTPSNVRLHFLPPNTTAHLQPCDAGIIWSFKAQYKKIFCKDRIDAFDISLESSVQPDPINIKDAIDFTAAAWQNVTPKTIHDSWVKTGILPDEFLHELLPIKELDESEPNPNPIDEIQSLINQWPLDQPMDAQKYIIADDELIATEMPTDEEIITAVMNRDCNEPEETAPEPISQAQALVFIDSVLCFLEQQPDGDFSVDNSFVRGLKKLRKEVSFKAIALKRQVTLDTFLHKSSQ